MPGRQHAPALVAGPQMGSQPGARRGGFGAVFVRALAVLALAAGVAAAVGLAAWTAGRSSVDTHAVRTEAYAAGRADAASALTARAKRAGGSSASASALSDGPPGGAAGRAWRRGFAAGRREGAAKTSFEQRAHGRALGAAAALGRFAGSWSVRGWYIVQIGPGSTLTGGQPSLARRVGPLGNGEHYGLCGAGRVCRSGARATE
jgi:hypothetical protein